MAYPVTELYARLVHHPARRGPGRRWRARRVFQIKEFAVED